MARKNERSDLASVIEVMEVTGGLEGKSFSITGHLGLTRPEVVKIIERAKGRFEERPNRLPYGRNSFLITNKDWNANSTVQKNKSSKLLEAERNGIKIISEDELYQMIIDGNPQKEAGGDLF